jgi:hypothetical protein
MVISCCRPLCAYCSSCCAFESGRVALLGSQWVWSGHCCSYMYVPWSSCWSLDAAHWHLRRLC